MYNMLRKEFFYVWGKNKIKETYDFSLSSSLSDYHLDLISHCGSSSQWPIEQHGKVSTHDTNILNTPRCVWERESNWREEEEKNNNWSVITVPLEAAVY